MRVGVGNYGNAGRIDQGPAYDTTRAVNFVIRSNIIGYHYWCGVDGGHVMLLMRLKALILHLTQKLYYIRIKLKP